ncbi:MAG: ribonuclease HII [Nanoarchaeota archaeon]
MLIIGIDDAGRGPLIGSMFLAGVLLNKKDETYLKTEGVKDSKLLPHSQRIKLSNIIKDQCIKYKIVSSSPREIDHSISSGVNLNTLEALKAAEIINSLVLGRKEKIQIIVDCPSVNTSAWKNLLLNYIKDSDKIELICEHKADLNYASVSAASILAKVAREDSVSELKKQFGDIGSGYPSDPNTKEFLRKHGHRLADSGIFRKSWQTWKSLFPEQGQKTLGDF